MTGINPIGPKNDPPKLTLDKLKQMDETSIFSNIDTDKNGEISDVEIKAAGFDSNELFAQAKDFLVKSFGTGKIKNSHNDNVTYFSYSDYNPEIIVPQTIEEIPKGSHDNIRDARFCDISKLNLSKEDLLNLTIDKTTILSPEQKEIIDKYIEITKDPGLGIRQLHEQGITGVGVNMAIIDQPLGYHREYASNLVGTHNINTDEFPNWQASMHGAAVASIAVGENVGVAPGTSLEYYSAINFTENPEDIENYKTCLLKEMEKKPKDKFPNAYEYAKSKLEGLEQNGTIKTNKPYAQALKQILDNNEKLPPEKRVSVVSISWGFDKLAPGWDELLEQIDRAKAQGVFVISTRLDELYGMKTCGANRNPQGDMNNPQDYEAGAFWKNNNDYSKEMIDELLLVPMDHRTVAYNQDGESYRYEGNDGGMSWSTPWLAGIYALTKQVKPDITPEEFWQKALETSDKCHNNDNNEYVGRLINPQKLINSLK